MNHSRRTLLKTTGLALTGALAGCNGRSGTNADENGTATGTDSGESTATPSSASARDVGAETAVAAEWTAMRARLYDALALGHAGRYASGARVAEDVYERFESASSEWGAHEQLETTNAENYEAFEKNLGELRSALEDGSLDAAADAVNDADGNLLAAQRGRTTAETANVFTLATFAARTRDVGVLAAGGSMDGALATGEATLEAFESAEVHDVLESAGQEYYEGFEGSLKGAISAAEKGDGDTAQSLAHEASTAVVDAAYELAPSTVADAGHLSLLQAAGFDARVLSGLGGPGIDYAHAASLNLYRIRVRDAQWLYHAGETDAAKGAAQSIFAHFEGARAHEALEEANHDAYEGFEHDGLEALVAAIDADDGAGVDSAVKTVHTNLTAGIETLAGGNAPLLESGYYRARLGDVRERYDRGDAEAAAGIAQSLFERFEKNEANFHEELEHTSESLYEKFEHEHLEALISALQEGDAAAVQTHVDGALDALESFETQAGTTALASGAAATYVTGRALDAGVRATLGDSDRAASIAQDAYAYFEAGAGGFHEAVEHASEKRYHAFEDALEAVQSAAPGDAYAAATTFADEALAATYAVVESAGGDATGDAKALAQSVFGTFEEARVHESLEEADHDAYENFEAALKAYVSALESGEGIGAKATAYAEATRTAQFAVVGAAGKAPAASAASGDGDHSSHDHGGGGDVTGGPNVVDGVPEDADHVVDMTAVAFEPAELTVQAGDTVAFAHAAGEAHTITATNLPDGATYWASGGFDSEEAARTGWSEQSEGGVTSGRAYVHTFETAGEHRYVCIPHEAAGMTGTVIVEE